MAPGMLIATACRSKIVAGRCIGGGAQGFPTPNHEHYKSINMNTSNKSNNSNNRNSSND